MTDIAIGSECWVFDGNRRFYRGNELIWRKHWTKQTVTGENRSSWLVGVGGFKIPKKHPGHTNRDAFGSKQVVWSKKELDRECWVHDHRHRIQRFCRAVDAEHLQLTVGTVHPPDHIHVQHGHRTR